MGEYHSFVFHSANAEAAQELRSHILKRYQFGGPQDAGTQITASAYGDAMSVSDAMRMALECRELDNYEQRELALELAECVNWDDCLRVFSEWGLAFLHGDLVPASAIEARSAETGNTDSAREGESATRRGTPK